MIPGGPGLQPGQQHQNGNIPGLRRDLIKAGFNVRATGGMNSRLQSAINNLNLFGAHRAAHWNAAHPRYAAVSNPPKNPPKNPPNNPPKSPPVHFPKGGGGGGGGGGLGAFNPNRVGHAMTNMQYNAVLNSLHQNMTNLQNQNKQNLADITGWYGSAANAQHATAAQDASAGHDALAQHDAATQAVLAALGGNSQAAGMIGSQAVSGSDLMSNLAANRANEDAASAANLKATQAEASTNQQNAGSQALQTLHDQLTSTLSQKGSALIKNIADAKQQRLQMLAEEQNMALAGKQFNINAALSQAQLNNTNLQNNALAKQISQYGKSKGQNGKTILLPWKKVGPADRQHMESSVGSSMYGPNGGANLSPNEAWVRAANALRLANPKWDVHNSPALRQWLSMLWKPYVDDYNAGHPKHPYKANGNGTPFTNQQWG